MYERPIIAALSFFTMLFVILLAVSFPEAQFLTGMVIGAVLSWVGQIVFFYFRKKEAG